MQTIKALKADYLSAGRESPYPFAHFVRRLNSGIFFTGLWKCRFCCILIENNNIMKTILTIFLLFAALTGFAQNQRITGTVYAKEDSLPIFAVSVKIKTMNISLLTDTNGKYTIYVPVNGILIFSCLGYAPQEIKITKRDTINIYLRRPDEKQ